MNNGNALICGALILISSLANADSVLVAKIINDDDICSLFYEDKKFIWFPNGVYISSHFKSNKSIFDANNDGKNDYLKFKENFNTYQTNMMYYAYDRPNTTDEDEYKFIFPQSWMKCRNSTSECDIERKIKSGRLVIGMVPGKVEPVYYRSRYTNAFPFMRKNSTYYKITTESFNKDVVSIIKPLPSNEEFELVCVFVMSEKL